MSTKYTGGSGGSAMGSVNCTSFILSQVRKFLLIVFLSKAEVEIFEKIILKNPGSGTEMA